MRTSHNGGKAVRRPPLVDAEKRGRLGCYSGLISLVIVAMKILKSVLIVIPLLCFSAVAGDSKPTEQSIKQLLEATKARKLLDEIAGQADGWLKSYMEALLKGQPTTAQDWQSIDKLRAKMVPIMKEALTWDKFEPLHLRLYRETFTQEEVDGMLAFYRTPAGQAVINKMPLLTKNAMTEMQRILVPITQRIQKLIEDDLKEIEAGTKK